MKYLKALVLGGFFGVIAVKAEVISWFRIQEMFWFESFHMYGVIGSAVVVGAISVFLLKKFKVKSTDGSLIDPQPKPFNKIGNFTGGIIFGLGWALTGACPGPLYALAGSGYSIFFLAIAAAILGVIVYGLVRKYLPH